MFNRRRYFFTMQNGFWFAIFSFPRGKTKSSINKIQIMRCEWDNDKESSNKIAGLLFLYSYSYPRGRRDWDWNLEAVLNVIVRLRYITLWRWWRRRRVKERDGTWIGTCSCLSLRGEFNRSSCRTENGQRNRRKRIIRESSSLREDVILLN